MNSYLQLAETVLKKVRRPLDARQMLSTAYQLSIVPDGLFGKTQHKTLHARLAEDIRRRRTDSVFVRTDPGRFFLRSLINDRSTPAIHRREYPAPPRADQLRNFDVPCIRKADAAFSYRGKLLDWSALNSTHVTTRRLADIYDDSSYIFLRTFVVTRRLHTIVMRRAFPRATDLIGKWSLGSLGFVKDHDKTMFSTDPYGIAEASLRTLQEQLNLNDEAAEFIYSKHLIRVRGFVPTPEEAKENSLVAIAVCHCPATFDPIERYEDPATLQWIPAHSTANDQGFLDPWSRELVASGIFQTLTK